MCTYVQMNMHIDSGGQCKAYCLNTLSINFGDRIPYEPGAHQLSCLLCSTSMGFSSLSGFSALGNKCALRLAFFIGTGIRLRIPYFFNKHLLTNNSLDLDSKYILLTYLRRIY